MAMVMVMVMVMVVVMVMVMERDREGQVITREKSPTCSEALFAVAHVQTRHCDWSIGSSEIEWTPHVSTLEIAKRA